MSFHKMFEYENESSIDPKLICSICLNPFTKPKVVICGHIFCCSCIQLWLKKNCSCPLCREYVLYRSGLSNLSNSIILNRLDGLYVKCLLCEQTQIQRKYFKYHIDSECPKMMVSCSMNPLKCSWKGYRTDLSAHRMICRQKKTKKNSLITDKIKIKFHHLKIETLIYQHPSNSTISLRNHQITDVDMPIIVKCAIRNRRCQILDLGLNQIVSYGILELAESLENNRTLEILSLHGNSLTNKSLLYLTEKLSLNNSALKWLDLEATNLNDTSAEYLAAMLISNQTLTGLWLSKNQIGYQGVTKLTSALTNYNTTLEYLDLENNPAIEDSCLDCLMEMIKCNQSLKTIYLNNCQLSSTSQEKLQELAKTKTKLRVIL